MAHVARELGISGGKKLRHSTFLDPKPVANTILFTCPHLVAFVEPGDHVSHYPIFWIPPLSLILEVSLLYRRGESKLLGSRTI